MKIIRQATISLLLLLITTSVLVSCSDSSTSGQPVNTSDLQINSDKKLTLSMEQKGSFTVKITSGRSFQYAIASKNGNWVVSKDPVDTIYPKGKGIKLKFNFDTNFSGEDRTAFLLFKNSDMDQYTDTVYVSQSKTLYIDLNTPGTLSKEIRNKGIIDSLQVKSLSLTGTLNSTDVLCLRQMAGGGKKAEEITKGQLTDLDISDINFIKDNTVYFIQPDGQPDKIYDPYLLLDYMFAYCSSIKTIKIPTSVIQIGTSAFSNCISLTSVNVPESVTKINELAFYNCMLLTDVNIPSAVKAIEEKVFSGCLSLESVKLPENVTLIDYEAFYGCHSLKRINLPEGLKEIYKHVFNGCSALTSITIPKTVTLIDDGAFDGCTSLATVIINIEAANITTGTLGASRPFDPNAKTILYVPKNSLSTYLNDYYRFTQFFKNRIVAQQ